jgi:A118 family predicted phage portal protein
MVTVKDSISSMADFYDRSYYYRQLAKLIYQGYVSGKTMKQFANVNAEFGRYAGYHDYSPKAGVNLIRKTANLPVIIGEYLVRNTYAEYPSITIKDEDFTKDFQEMLDDNDFARNEKDLFETQIQLGGRYFSFFKKESKFKIKYITADRGFVTARKQNKPNEAVFITNTVKMEKTGMSNKLKPVNYTLLEWHYEIDSETRGVKSDLYRSNSSGRFVRQSTQLIPHIFGEAIDIEEQEYKMTVPTFVYIKNPIKNNKDLNSPEGLGAFINAIDDLMLVDEAFDVISKEIVYGSMKVQVPEGATEEIPDYTGNKTYRHYDPNAPEIMVYNTSESGLESYEPKAFAPQLRIQDQLMAFNMGLDMVSVAMGIQAGAIRFDGKSFGTATEAKIQKGDTANTIKLYEQNNSDGFKDLAIMWKQVSNAETDLPNVPEFTREDITVIHKDNIVEDDESLKENDRKVIDAGLEERAWYWTERGFSPEDAAEKIAKADADKKKQQEEFGFSITEDEVDENNPDGNEDTDDTEEDSVDVE